MNKPRKPDQKNLQEPSGRIIHAQQTTVYKGQLPPPDMLEKFEAIQPGFTDRLFKMVEDESQFKREQDRRMLNSFKMSTILGIVFAFLSVLIVSAVAVYAIYSGFGGAGASIMATCIVVLLSLFYREESETQMRKQVDCNFFRW